MNTVRTTIKGKKFKISKGSVLNIYEDGKRILIEPIHQDIVREGKGILKTKGRVLKTLIAERKAE
jgi:hypothetical protein